MEHDTHALSATTTHRPDAGDAPVNGNADRSVRAPQPIRRTDARGGMIGSRVAWLDLPSPWDNLQIRAWLDFPKSVADLWQAADGESRDDASARITMACQQTFLDTRAACDHPGDPQACTQGHEPWAIDDDLGALPEPSYAEFWERIPTPLFKAIVERFVAELADSPTSRASRRWKQQTSRRR